MEKAKTASSTSRSSGIRWRRSMPARAHQGAPSHGSHRTSSPLFVQWQLQRRRPSCSRRGRSGGCWCWWCCGCLHSDVDGGDNNACHTPSNDSWPGWNLASARSMTRTIKARYDSAGILVRGC